MRSIKKDETAEWGKVMGLDARVRYTKMVIKNSFITLLKIKPVNKITVKKICELSEINRATFYKYYCDAYDLLDKLEQECLDELLQTVDNSTQQGFKDTFTLILVNLKAEGELYQTLFSENGDKSFPNRIFALCYSRSAMDKNFEKLSPTQQKWLYYFVAQGCSGILNQWICSGMSEPIHEVVDFTDKLVENTIKQI